MHFDFQVDDVAAAVGKAEALGAVKTEAQFGGNLFVTMLDRPDIRSACAKRNMHKRRKASVPSSGLFFRRFEETGKTI